VATAAAVAVTAGVVTAATFDTEILGSWETGVAEALTIGDLPAPEISFVVILDAAFSVAGAGLLTGVFPASEAGGAGEGFAKPPPPTAEGGHAIPRPVLPVEAAPPSGTVAEAGAAKENPDDGVGENVIPVMDGASDDLDTKLEGAEERAAKAAPRSLAARGGANAAGGAAAAAGAGRSICSPPCSGEVLAGDISS
jgi:hypothetical protein